MTNTREIRVGDRVFVAGTTGKFGKVVGVQTQRGHPPAYYVRLEGDQGMSGPFVDTWKDAPPK